MPTYNISENVTEALKESGLKSEHALWDCHGTWVLKHYACERIAANKGITFDEPEMIEADSSKGVVIILVRGFLGDKLEWSFGECTPKNSKNSYPYAMAEKRAKDRVILKLIGLHGEVYSEEEAEEFKAEIAAQEKAEKKVDTSVWNGVPKKEVNDARNNLDSLYATWTAKGGNSAAGKKAKKEADDINKWAEKHELVIVIDKYLSLFDRPQATKLIK